MSTGGEAADQMVREGIMVTESALKLAGLGAKNLAALLIAVINENPRMTGKTKIQRLIRDGEELTIFSIDKSQMKSFNKAAKHYGILYCPIHNKLDDSGKVEIMVKARDANQINRILARLGCLLPGQDEKKTSDALSGRNSVTPQPVRETTAPSTDDRPQQGRSSVREKLARCQKNAAKQHPSRPLERGIPALPKARGKIGGLER